jgi:hypothetical protein
VGIVYVNTAVNNSVFISGTSFVNNSAENGGGGVAVVFKADAAGNEIVLWRGCSLISNQGMTGFGGGFSVSFNGDASGNCVVMRPNLVFRGNSARQGGAVFLQFQRSAYRNSLEMSSWAPVYTPTVPTGKRRGVILSPLSTKAF